MGWKKHSCLTGGWLEACIKAVVEWTQLYLMAVYSLNHFTYILVIWNSWPAPHEHGIDVTIRPRTSEAIKVNLPTPIEGRLKFSDFVFGTYFAFRVEFLPKF